MTRLRGGCHGQKVAFQSDQGGGTTTRFLQGLEVWHPLAIVVSGRGGAAGETHLTHRPSVKPSATSVTSVHRGSPSALGAEPCRHIGERQCPETGKAKSLGLPACARSAVLPASRKRGKSSEKGREPGPHH